MIPRVINQIWIGPHDPPYELMDGWRLPGWDYRLWRDEDIDQLGLLNRRTYNHYRRVERWSGAANIARVEILADQGGVYIDADIEMVSPLDDAPFMDAQMWAVRSPLPNRLNNAAMGCVPGAAGMLAYLEELARVAPWWRPLIRQSLHPSAQVTGGSLLTSIAAAHDVVWVDAGAFTVHDQHGNPIAYDGVVYGDHKWGTTSGRWQPSKSTTEWRRLIAKSRRLRRTYHWIRGTRPWEDLT